MIRNIHMLRGIATMTVVAFHFGLEGFWPRTAWVRPFEPASIDLFLLISGYLMVVIAREKDYSPYDFVRRRVAKSGPLYWIVTLLLFLISLRSSHFVSSQPTIVDLIRSILFIPYQRANGLVQPVLYVGWTLNLEFAFYVLIAASAFARPAKLRWIFVLTVLLGLYALGRTVEPSGVLGFYTQPSVLAFALGVGAGWGEKAVKALPTIGACALAAAGLAAIILGPHDVPSPSHLIGSALLLVGALGLELRGWSQKFPGAMLLGDLSLSIYLTHPLVGHALMLAAARLHLSVSSLAPVSIPAVLVVAFATHHLVEKPLATAALRITKPSRRAYGPASIGSGAGVTRA